MVCNRLAWVLSAAVGAIPAGAQDKTWIRQFGTSEWDTPASLSPDGSGGVIVAGYTNGSLGGGNAGEADAWVARRDASGNQIWVKQFGTSLSDGAFALAQDSSGAVFIAGVTSTGANVGGWDGWIARYDDSGNQSWIRHFGTSADDWAWALAPDGAGGVFIAGYTGGSLGGMNTGSDDAWLARYDASGNRIWIRQFGTNTEDQARALAADGAGGVFIAGYTRGILGGMSAGGRDVWLARYDASGNETWITQFGTSTDERAFALAPDSIGGVYIAGWTAGRLGGEHAGELDAWLARFDSSGDQAWIRQFGTSERDHAMALAADRIGGVFVAGYTYGSLGGENAGISDPWLARFDSSGGQTWIRQFGTSEYDHAWALAQDGAGGVYIAGETNGSLGGPNAGSFDGWLALYGGDPPVEVMPDSFARLRGLPVSGELADVFESDDSRLVTRPGDLRTTAVAPVQVQFTGLSPEEDPSEIVLTIESHTSVNNVFQRTYLYNYDTATFDSVDSRVLATSDLTVEIHIEFDASRYVKDGTGEMMVLTQYNAIAFSIAPTWHARQDQVIWTITP